MRPRSVAAALALAALAGCTSGRTAPSPAPGTPAATAPAGTLRFGYGSEPPTLNPLSPAGGSHATRDILRPLLPALYRLDARGRPRGDLVERATVRLDPFTVDLRLRDARWSDGTAISCADLAFSLGALRGGPTGARYRFLREVRTTDARRCALVFDRPVRRWWALFSIDDMVLPAHAFGDGSAFDRAVPVSGGPFVFAGWTPGLSIRLGRNDAWTGERAQVAAIEVVFVPDDETRLQIAARGELDVVFSQGEGNVGERAKARGLRASGDWGGTWYELHLDVTELKDQADAIGRAIDRHILAELFDDSGQVIDGIPAVFPAPGPDADFRPGLPGPWPAPGPVPKLRAREVVLAFAHTPPTAGSIARAIHFRLRPTGVRAEVVSVDPVQLERDWLPNGRAAAYLVLRRAADAPDAAAYRSDAPATRNPSRVSSADAALEEAETAATPEELRAGPVTGLAAGPWMRAQQALVASGGVFPLVRVRSWLVSRTGVTGPGTAGHGSGPLWNAHGWRGA